MLKYFKHIIVAILLIISCTNTIQAQTSTSEDTELRRRTDSIVQAVREYFDEILDVEIGWAALQTRHISNVGYGLDNAIGLNRELRDTIEVIREIVQSEIFVRSLIDYDHFWTRFINREKYSPKEGELGRNVGELYSRELKFDIVFKPAWDTSIEDDVDVARKAGQLAYTCEITVEGEGMFTAEISQSEMETALNEAVASTSYTKIKSEAAPAVNQGMFTGLLWLAEKFDYVPFKDPSNIERVVFSMPDTSTIAGYDKYNEQLQGNYETTSIKGKQYPVDWKSVSNKSNDQVLATVKKKNKNAPVNDTLKFASSNGTPYPAIKQNDSTYLITLPPASSKEEIALLATYTYADSTGKDVKVTVGQANIAAYVEQAMNLVIVPMIDLPAGITAQSIQTELNKVYAQAATTWNVSKVTSKLVVDGINASSIDDGDSQLLSNYTDGMNAVIDAFKDSEVDIDKNTCYLFLAGQGASGFSKCGFMPLKRQFGFIFLNSACNSEAEIQRTIAHELGHGPFRLYHTFSSHSEYYRSEGSTNNLMDYTGEPNPTALNKYQWDLIHDPESMIALFQDEEEGAAYGTNLPLTDAKWYTPENTSEVTFLTPSGKPFKIKNIKRLLVTTGSISLNFDDNGNLDSEGKVTLSADRGVVIAFEQENNGEIELWTASTQNRTTKKGERYIDFFGYKNDYYGNYKYDNTSPSETYFECFYVNKSGSPTKLVLDYKKKLNEFLIGEQKSKYTGAGVFVGDIADFAAKINLPEDVYNSTDFSKVDVYGHTIWAKFDYFKNKGLLQKIFKDREYLYLYTTTDSRGNKQYYQFDLYLNRWRNFIFDEATLADIFDYDVMSQVYDDFAEIGHTALDGLGFIPGLGEICDAINGFWYLAEGEYGEMALCFGSCIPIIGDATFKGAKYVKKALDAAALARIADLGTNKEIFGAISAVLKATDQAKYAKCLDEISKLLTDFPYQSDLIKQMVDAIPDPEILLPVLSKIDELPSTPTNLKAIFLNDLAKNTTFATKFFEKVVDAPGLVESWKVLQNAPDAVRRNTSVLDEVAKLRTKTLANGDALDIQKLFDNGFGNTLNSLSDADKTKMLARMNDWDAKHVDDLARRLGKDNYPELADDITNPDFFKLYDDIIHDPENAIDIAKRAGDGNLLTTAKSTFFNNVTQLGKDFEKVVAPALKPGGAWRNKLKTLLKDKFGVDDLDSYEMFEQVHLTYNKSTGDYFVADQVFVKYKTVAGQKVVDDIIVIENKLSDATKLTGNQSTAKTVSKYYSKGDKLGIPRESPVSFKGGDIKWLKAYGNGDGKTIVDLTETF